MASLTQRLYNCIIGLKVSLLGQTDRGIQHRLLKEATEQNKSKGDFILAFSNATRHSDKLCDCNGFVNAS